MNDAASAVFHALMDCEKSDDEIAVDTGLSLAAVRASLYSLLREQRVQKQTDNGVVFWRLG